MLQSRHSTRNADIYILIFSTEDPPVMVLEAGKAFSSIPSKYLHFNIQKWYTYKTGNLPIFFSVDRIETCINPMHPSPVLQGCPLAKKRDKIWRLPSLLFFFNRSSSPPTKQIQRLPCPFPNPYTTSLAVFFDKWRSKSPTFQHSRAAIPHARAAMKKNLFCAGVSSNFFRGINFTSIESIPLI